MNTLKTAAASLALVAALAAAGCGGGGGGNQQYSQMTPTPVSPAPAPTPAPPPPPVSESFNVWLSGVIAKPSDGNGLPVDMDQLSFVFDVDTDAYASLFAGLE